MMFLDYQITPRNTVSSNCTPQRKNSAKGCGDRAEEMMEEAINFPRERPPIAISMFDDVSKDDDDVWGNSS